LKDEKIDYLLAGTVITSIFVLLYAFRYLDDNTLTSWYWVFQTDEVDARVVLAAGAVGVILAYFLPDLRLRERRPRVVLFCLSFLAGAYFWRSPEAIVDAARYFTYAKETAEYGVVFFLREWGGEINPWTDLPAMPLIYGLLFKLLGEERIYAQLLNTLLFSCTVVMVYSIGERLWGRGVGFNAGLFLLAMPYLFTQVPLLLVDISTMFFLVFAAYTALEAVERRSVPYALLASLGVSLSFYSKFSTWAMLSIIPVILLIRRGPGVGRIAGVLAFSSVAVIAVTFYIKSDTILAQLDLLQSYQRPMLQVWGESHLSTYFFQVHPIVTLAASYSIYLSHKRRDLRYVVIGWLPILVILLDVKRIRYLIPVFPMLALMASYGIQGVKNQRLRDFIVYAAVGFSISIAALAYLPFLQSLSASNLMEAGEILDGLEQEHVVVYTLPPRENRYNPSVSVPLLDFFTRKKILYMGEDVPMPPHAERSPLRFTWEYRVPDYYEPFIRPQNPAVVVISQDLTPLPGHIDRELRDAGYVLHRVLDKKSKRPYLYRTVVRVYLQNNGE
jgi:hypothetical protein